MNTAASAFRPSCGRETDLRPGLPAPSATGLPVQLGQVKPALLGVEPLVDAPPSTVAAVLHDASGALPHGLLADLVELNGGQPVTTALAGLVWELGELLVDAQEKCRAVWDVLTNAGFGACGQPLPDAVAEMVLLATEGEVAYALLFEAGYMTESHRVRDALQEALAAAAGTEAARQIPGAHGFLYDSGT